MSENKPTQSSIPSDSINGISEKSFNKLNDEQKQLVLIGNNDIQTKNTESDILGQFFGSNTKNASIHIAFLICIVSLIFCGIDLIHSFASNQPITSEIWDLIFPVITLSLGYIFGKGEQ